MQIGGRYRLRQRIAEGGMGEVWLAWDEGPGGFRKTVAVKRMLPGSDAYLDYFRAEARLMARLPHPNIVQVLGFVLDEEGQHNIVMEYVEGLDLQALLQEERGQLSVEMAVYIASELCKGLDFLHNVRVDGKHAQLVHRDISPHNILISCNAEVKITDFGVAKASLDWRKRTEGNQFRGKFCWSPPEAFEQIEVDHRMDIYSAGVVLYEMLAHRQAFPGTTQQAIAKVLAGQVEPLETLNPLVNRSLAQVVARMMHRDREQRFPSAQVARLALCDAMPAAALGDEAIKTFVRAAGARSRRLTSPFFLPVGADASPLQTIDPSGHTAPLRRLTEVLPVDGAAWILPKESDATPSEIKLAVPPARTEIAGRRIGRPGDRTAQLGDRRASAKPVPEFIPDEPDKHVFVAERGGGYERRRRKRDSATLMVARSPRRVGKVLALILASIVIAGLGGAARYFAEHGALKLPWPRHALEQPSRSGASTGSGQAER